MLQSTLTIQKTAFLEIVRHPAYYLLTILAALLILISQKIVLFGFHSELNMIRELGLSTIILWGVISCILFSHQSVFMELENRSAMTLLAKPVRRTDYILGKYLGLARSSFLGVLFLLLTLILTLWLHEGLPKLSRLQLKASSALIHFEFQQEPGESLEGPIKSLGGLSFATAVGSASASPTSLIWSYFINEFVSLNIWPILLGAVLAFLHTAVVTSFALLLATFFQPVVVAAGTLAFYLVGHLTDTLAGALTGDGTLLSIVRQLMHAALPNLELFTPADHLSRGEAVSAIYVALTLLYGILYVSVLLGLTSFAFSRRELP